jgi:hypothetical protein
MVHLSNLSDQLDLLLQQPELPGETKQPILALKELVEQPVGERVRTVGYLFVDYSSGTAELLTEPSWLKERFFSSEAYISIQRPDGKLQVMRDYLMPPTGTILNFRLYEPQSAFDVRELVMVSYPAEGSGVSCDSLQPLPPPGTGVAMVDLPLCFSKVCTIWYRDPEGNIQVFTDQVHSWFGGHLSFMHRGPIALQDVAHIRPLESVDAELRTKSALPEHDPEPINRSMP